MIKEYAVDPNLEYTLDKLRFYVGQFGLDKGRLISRFPRQWKYILRENLQAPPKQKKRFEEILSQLDDKVWDRKRQFTEGQDWLVNAETDHMREPFAGIITSDNPRGQSHVILDEALDESHPLFGNNTDQRVQRDPRVMGNFLEPLFASAKWIKFIDPHFYPEPEDIRGVLKPNRWMYLFLGCLIRCSNRIDVDYHACRQQTNRGKRAPSGQDEAADLKNWERSCRGDFLKLLPKDRKIRVVRWQEIAFGKWFHARHIITDKAGIMIDPGLDCDWNTSGDTALVKLITPQERAEVLYEVADASTTFTRISEHEVIGTGEAFTEELRKGLTGA